MADELRELRKTAGQKSVSKMKLFEISAEIERLKHHTATTPHSASYTTNKSTPAVEAKVKDVKKAKEVEFAVVPKVVASTKKVSVAKEKVVEKKAPLKKIAEKAPVKKGKKVEVVSESE